MKQRGTNGPGGRRRADARRNVESIVDAAVAVWAERSNASVEDIARAAGLSRQTVYTHFPSRDRLVAAVLDRATDETLAALDAAKLDDGPAREALARLFDASWAVLERYPFVLDVSSVHISDGEDRDRHAPVVGRLERLFRRGQQVGEFDPSLPVSWLVAATVALGHAAGAEVAAGRMTVPEATRAACEAVQRLAAAHGSTRPRSPRRRG